MLCKRLDATRGPHASGLAERLALCADFADVVRNGAAPGRLFIAQRNRCGSPACPVCQLVQQRRYQARYAFVSAWLAERFPVLNVTLATLTEKPTQLDRFTENLNGFKRCAGRLVRSLGPACGGYIKKIEFAPSRDECLGIHVHMVLLLPKEDEQDLSSESLSSAWQRLRRLPYSPNADLRPIPLTGPTRAFARLGKYFFKPLAPRGDHFAEFARAAHFLGERPRPRVCHGGLVRMALHDCDRLRKGFQ